MSLPTPCGPRSQKHIGEGHEFTISETPEVVVCTSKPRLGFTEHEDCFRRLMEGIGNPTVIPTSGWPWEKCLENGIDFALHEYMPDYILFTDYDSVFRPQDYHKLLRVAQSHPELAAVFPVQAHRHKDMPIALSPHLSYEDDYTEQLMAHFGLTLIRSEMLLMLPKPWFWGMPNRETHVWDKDSIDPDMFFWWQVYDAGFRTAQVNDVVIGHMEIAIRWPTTRGIAWQPLKHYRANGAPDNVGLRPECYKTEPKAAELTEVEVVEV